MIPLIYILKGSIFLGYYYIEDPKSVQWYIMAPLMTVMLHVPMMVILGYQQVMYPKDIRGILCSFQGIAQTLMGLISAFYYRWIFDTYGDKMPWFGSAVISFASALFFGILGICNLFGNMKDNIPKDDEEEE